MDGRRTSSVRSCTSIVNLMLWIVSSWVEDKSHLIPFREVYCRGRNQWHHSFWGVDNSQISQTAIFEGG